MASPATISSSDTGTRQAVLDAALQCFTEQGFAATTIADIRTRSGASTGSIYHHFAGKEQIAASLYVGGLADYQAGLGATLQRNPGAEGGVRAIVRHHLRWVVANPQLARFLSDRRETELVEATASRVRELNRTAFARFREWHARHAAAGLLRDLPFDLLHAIVLGPAQELSRHWLAGNTSLSPTKAERALADAAWRALSTHEGAPG
jgi:AcrR family transcriptional regulator